MSSRGAGQSSRRLPRKADEPSADRHDREALLRAGYAYIPYSSMESIIGRNKDSYYLVLRRTQQTIRKEEQNWEPWLVFFLKTMAKQKVSLAKKK